MNNDLTAAIVRICDSRGSSVGTGFVVTAANKDNHFAVVTCAHVVEAARGQPGGPIEIAFQVGPGPHSAVVAGWSAPAEHDIAILVPAAPLPTGVEPLFLGPSCYSTGHGFMTFGYAGVGNKGESHARGDILGQLDSGHLLQISSTELTRGFSGAPIFDRVMKRVVGVMREFPIYEDMRGGIPRALAGDEFGRQQDINYATPSEIIQQIWPPLRLSEICPYQGLAAFTEDDADYFCGRETLVDQLLARLKQSPRFLAIVGASGSGKSSLVAAGLFPALRQGRAPGSEQWHLLPFQPGNTPFSALARSGLAAEPSGDVGRAVASFLEQHTEATRLVLYADQFEQLFAGPSRAGQHRFLEVLQSLLNSDLPLTFMFTIRADYYQCLLDQSYLVERLKTGQVNIPPLRKAVLPAIIARPAEKVGLTFDPPALVEQIADDATRIDHPLPLLESALTRLWEQRENGTLTLAAYQKIGRVTGAITQWADDTYSGLGPPERKAARRIFTRLGHYGQGAAPDARRSLTLKDLVTNSGDQAEVDTVHRLVTKLAGANLLVTDKESGQETVEIIHDALLTEWGTLRRWVATEREFLLWRQRLGDRMQSWQEGTGELLHDAALAEAESWLNSKNEDLNTTERNFIQSSIDARERREARRHRKNRILAGVAIVAMVLAILAAFFWLQTEQRRKEAEQSAQRVIAASAQRALIDHDTDLAIALSLEANRGHQTPAEVRQTLVDVAYYSIAASETLEGHTDAVTAVAFSPEGSIAVSASADDTLILWDIALGTQIGCLEGHTDDVLSVAFSPDGQAIISGSADDTLILWDTASRAALRTYSGHAGDVQSVAFSPDGQTIISGSADNSLRLWDAATTQEIRLFEGHVAPVSQAAFNRDGQTVVSGDKDDRLCEWEVATGEQKTCIQPAASHGIFSFAIAPDQHTVVVGAAGYGPEIFIVNLDSGSVQGYPAGHKGGNTKIALSPDSRFVISGTYDNSLILWDLTRGLILHRLLGHAGDVTAVAVSPDEGVILSGSADHTLRLWDVFRSGAESYRIPDSLGLALSPDGQRTASWLEVDQVGPVVVRDAETGQTIGTTPTSIAGLWSLAFSPADDKLYIGDWTGSIWHWDLGSESLRRFEGLHPGRVTSIALSPDGRIALSGSYGPADPSHPDWERVLLSWDTATGEVLAAYPGHRSHIRNVALSADGQIALSASNDRTACVWQVETGQPTQCFEGHNEGVNHVIFGTAQSTALTASDDRTIRLWDITTGREIRRFTGHTAGVLSLSLSPDGRTVASGSGDSSIRLWNIDTGAEISRITRDYGPVKNVFFGPDPHILFSRADDHAIRRWRIVTQQDLDSQDWVRWTCDHRYVRPLSCDERRAYAIEPQCEPDQPPPPTVCETDTG